MKKIKIAAGLAHVDYGHLADLVKDATEAGADYIHSDAADMHDLKNMQLLLQAGATILPANPHFYFKPKTIEEVADTVVSRVLDHLGVKNEASPRWQEEE